MSRPLEIPALQFPLNRGLRNTSRLGWLVTDSPAPHVLEWGCVILAGMAAAAASTFLDFNLRVPGHAILRAVFPMTAGLALVPRRGAGTVMGIVAFATAMALRSAGFAGEGLSLGALTSLTATGPLLDWTLRRTQGGWRLYLSCACAGLASNLLALLVRGTAKFAGWEHTGARSFASWLPQAAATYVACGFLVGLLSAAIWFYGRRRDGSSERRP